MLTVGLSRSLECSLKQYRAEQASRSGVSRYSVLGDTVIRQLATTRPRNATELREVRGMSQARIDRYGDDIVRLVCACQLHMIHPEPRVTVRHSPPPHAHTRPHKPTARSKLPKPRHAIDLALLPPGNRSQAVLALKQPEDEVYIIELEHGKVYVGKSAHVARRVKQHEAGGGAAWTKLYPPTGVRLPRLGNVRGAGDAAERDETLRYMALRGTSNVRGWRYTAVNLTQAEHDDAEANIRELFDLCRRCGCTSHFATKCKATFDRNGKTIY